MSAPDVQQGGPWPRRGAGRSWRRTARETGNPLLREPTPAERRTRLLTWSLFVLIVALAVIGCGVVLRTGLAAERAEADRRPIRVTVVAQLQPTTASGSYLSDGLLQVSYQAGGVTRQGTLPSLFGASPGATLDAWIDHQGALVSRPQTRAVTVAQTLLAVVGGLVLLGSLALGAHAALSAWSMHLRSQEWEAEWLALDTGRTA
ncbi:MAG TPA: hypothetical protein VFP72_23545 [Kineosporiaceae bacterium]|nr:hypothetical protein [Kineosporiaceae bacterium]